jgi:putative FmdB family regulatory protein
VPVYEYRCKKCAHQFERVQKMNDPPIRRCERCGSSVVKIISSSGIVFKGTGWYVTDYSKKMKEKKTETNGDKKETKTSTPVPSSKKSPDK